MGITKTPKPTSVTIAAQPDGRTAVYVEGKFKTQRETQEAAIRFAKQEAERIKKRRETLARALRLSRP